MELALGDFAVKRFLVALILAISFVAPAWANPPFELGPPTASRIPDIGALQDESGRPRTLDTLMGQKGLVLFFFRSAAWCPYCQLQLMNLNEGLSAIEGKGYRLAGISYEPPAVDARFIKERGIGYTLLSDPGSKIIDRFGLRDPQYKPGSRAYGVPRPIIFVLDRNGVIQAKLYEATFQKRPPVSLVIETLDKVRTGKAP